MNEFNFQRFKAMQLTCYKAVLLARTGMRRNLDTSAWDCPKVGLKSTCRGAIYELQYSGLLFAWHLDEVDYVSNFPVPIEVVNDS